MAPARPIVSAALIVRDEEAVLGRCLASIAPWCDEIVVVDTGSTDATMDIARQFGATCGFYAWNDDFGAARNASFDLATGEWLLYIDADEYFDPVERDVALDELARYPSALAFALARVGKPGFTAYRECRLWRNRPDIRCVGRIHETWMPDLQRIHLEERRPILATDVFFMHHDGYEGDQTRKHLRNLPLLRQRLGELPDRCYLWFHLGTVLLDLDRHDEAVDAWQSGVDIVRRLGVRDASDMLCFGALAALLLADGSDVSDLVTEMYRREPRFCMAWWLDAANHRAQHRYAESVDPLRRLIARGTDQVDALYTYDRRLFTDWAWDALSDSLCELGAVAAAADVYEQALRTRPGSIELRTKAAALRLLASHQ